MNWVSQLYISVLYQVYQHILMIETSNGRLGTIGNVGQIHIRTHHILREISDPQRWKDESLQERQSAIKRNEDDTCVSLLWKEYVKKFSGHIHAHSLSGLQLEDSLMHLVDHCNLGDKSEFDIFALGKEQEFGQSIYLLQKGSQGTEVISLPHVLVKIPVAIIQG